MVKVCISNESGSFKFENMWLKAEGFVEQVRWQWVVIIITGSPGSILAQK